MRAQKQQYREQKQDKIKQDREQNKDRIREQKQQYREQNSNKCTCVCGSVVNKLNMCKHIKTEKHKQTMNMTSSEHEEHNGDVSTAASDIGSDIPKSQ